MVKLSSLLETLEIKPMELIFGLSIKFCEIYIPMYKVYKYYLMNNKMNILYPSI